MELNSALDSNDYFMSVAFLTTLRSEDSSTKVGACIISKHGKIVGLGYNKSPGNISISWNKKDDSHDYLQSKYPDVLHAEMDAILNKTCESLQDCTMYSLVLPWNECAKLIIESGIKKLVYYVDKFSTSKDKGYMDASKILFAKAKVICEKFVPRQNDTALFLNRMENKQFLGVVLMQLVHFQITCRKFKLTKFIENN